MHLSPSNDLVCLQVSLREDVTVKFILRLQKLLLVYLKVFIVRERSNGQRLTLARVVCQLRDKLSRLITYGLSG
jgi:hypothetical protein